ncbi:MAG: restriction endonuclease, partial [Planctomycetota bacterium]
ETSVDKSVSPVTFGADKQIAPRTAPAEPIESVFPVSEDVARSTLDWFTGLLVTSTNAAPSVPLIADRTRNTCESEEVVPQVSENQEAIASLQRNPTGLMKTGVVQLGAASNAALDAARSGVVMALIKGIRMVSAERDRDEILRWFVNARQILAQGSSTTETAKDLYRSVDTLRFAKLLANTVSTSVSNYQGANLPLSLKVALPVTAIGAALFGMKYAGLVALGSGIGLPVILLLFLGTAGATAIIEAFVKDRNIRDPLTKLLLTFVAFETARRAKKELLDAMRADAMVPQRAEVPDDSAGLLAYLMEMDPVMFERHVMSFFEKDGYPTGLTARSNDFGVDGYVFHPDGVIVVQCKRYGADNAVGRPAIQQFKGVIEEQRAFKGYFVTTSRFTDEARESAAKSDRILLIDGNELIRWHKAGSKQE